jgi:hypothetical protein
MYSKLKNIWQDWWYSYFIQNLNQDFWVKLHIKTMEILDKNPNVVAYSNFEENEKYQEVYINDKKALDSIPRYLFGMPTQIFYRQDNNSYRGGKDFLLKTNEIDYKSYNRYLQEMYWLFYSDKKPIETFFVKLMISLFWTLKPTVDKF